MDQKIEQLQKLVTTEKPEKADAIVWLQGNEYDRGKKVLELYKGEFAPRIVIAGNNTRQVDDDRVRITDIMRWLEAYGIDRSAIVADDQSMNTLEQAMHVVAMAKKQDWQSILLVGSTHHQLRAFLTFLHQTRVQGWQGRIINQPAVIPWGVKPSGRKKTTHEAFQDELVKVQEYGGSLASIEDGLSYLQQLNL